VLLLEAVKWTTDSARATAVVRQDGVWVKNGAPERRYLGTVRLYAVGTTIDSQDQRFVWNVDNRVPRMLFKRADAASWTYSGAGVWRMANASAANRVEMVLGLPDSWVDADLSCGAQTASGGTLVVGLGLDDAVNPPSASSPTVIEAYFTNASASNIRTQMSGRTWGQLSIGFHYLQWMEVTNNASVTFYGQTTSGSHGINGIVEG
jgi:hypothetical protein